MESKRGDKIVNRLFYRYGLMTAVIVILIAVFFVAQSEAATYYVKPTGDDTKNGLNAGGQAWQTIQKAADTMVAGDTVEVQAGTYNIGTKTGGYNGGGVYPPDPMYPLAARVLISTSGTAGNYITYHANGAVIVEGAGANLDIGFYLYQVQYVKIDGFTVQNMVGPAGHNNWGNGILLDMSKNCIIQNNACHDNGANGICIGRVTGLPSGAIDWSTSRGGSDSNQILNNLCYLNGSTTVAGKWGAGIQLFGNEDTLDGWGWVDGSGNYNSRNNIIRYNYCYSNWAKGVGIIGYGINNYVEFNILYNNFGTSSGEGSGIIVFRNAGNSTTYVRSNTITGHTQGYGDGFVSWDTWAADVGITNNIITGNLKGIRRGNQDVYKAGFMGNGYNNVWNNTTNYSNCAAMGTDTSYDPQYSANHTGIWSTGFVLKHKYNADRSPSGDTLNSPCVDHGSGVAFTAPDKACDKGAHAGDIYIGYPDPPASPSLGWADASFVNGGWHNDRSNIRLSFNLEDPVEPDSVENVRARYQIQYESKSFIPTYGNWSGWYSGAPYPVSVNYIYGGMAACNEGQYHWRVNCEDSIINISTWTYANSNNIAFGIDVTTPTVVNTLAGTTTVGASSATLTWNDVDDSFPKTVPNTPPLGYKRISGPATYNIYRSTFTSISWNWNTWKAQVIALNTNKQSKRIVEPRGVLAAGAAHLKVNPPDAGLPYVDGKVAGDELTVGQTYYYNITSIDNAGNESDQGIEFSIDVGVVVSGPTTLVYLIDSGGQTGAGKKTPCYGDSGSPVPTNQDVEVDVNSSTTTCILTNYATAAYSVGNNHTVRHYAKITTGVGVNPPEIRFYYTTGTRRAGDSMPGVPEVWTNVDSSSGTASNPNPRFINGIIYSGSAAPPLGVVDGTATYFYADIPTDINACGDASWAAASPWGVVGVRISGHQRTDSTLPLADGNGDWKNEQPTTANTYTYYVRMTAGGYKAATNPGEKTNDVRLQPMRHKWSDLLQSSATAICYFMPVDAAPADNLYMDVNRFTMSGLTDNKGDIFYGEYPGLYVRLAYADGEVGVGNSYIVHRSSTTAYDSNPGWLNPPDNPLDLVGTGVVSGIDNNANNSFASAFTDDFYGHFNFMKSPVNTALMSLPESIDVRYYFSIKDGTDRGFCYGGGATKTLATAQAGNQFVYTVMQDDYSRPYVKFTVADASALQPQSVTDPGDSSWISYYTVTAELWDLNNGNFSAVPATYGNVVSGRGANSGIYKNPNPNAMGTAAPRSPVHDTRVYYRISSTPKPVGVAADKYLTGATVPNFNYIPDDADTTYTWKGDPTGYVQMSDLGGGVWKAEIPLKETYAGQYIYYRVYVCNDDHDPQAYNSPSGNYITGAGAATVGPDTTDTYNRHTAVAFGGAYADPYNIATPLIDEPDTDRDHGWATYTRYGGKIIGLKMIKIRSKVTIGGVTKTITAYVNAEGNAVGNVIFTEMEKNEP